MVVCTATMPPEMIQSPAMKMEPPKPMDNAKNPEPGDPGEGGGVAEEDREEGEIVDDFELIISSEDEEFKLRARIQQLEENNKDVERMDMLSANLAHQYNYPKPVLRLSLPRPKSSAYILSDVSSQSEDDFEARRKHRKNKVRRQELGKRNHHSLSGNYRRNPLTRRHKQASPPSPVTTQRRRHYHQQSNHRQHRYQQHYTLDDSLGSLSDSELGEYDANDDNENDEIDLQRLKLNRDKLRVALARDDIASNYKNSLRERLQYRMRKSPSPGQRKEYEQEVELPLPTLQRLSDDGEEVFEDEAPPEIKLRLLALKSAVLKKHLARKKRDAERAYSPTDMINRVHPAISNVDDIDDLMEISPAVSPDQVQSPPRFSIDYAVDTKPVDMELAETDSDDQQINGWTSWSNNWNSIENPGGSWRCFLPNNLPPVSVPIVIDEEDEQDIKTDDRTRRENRVYEDSDDEIPPPPPFHIPHMHIEDDDARDAMHLVDQYSNHSSIMEMQSVSMENSQSHMRTTEDQSQPDSSDDEAGALRAILLSSFRTNKPPPPPPPPTSPPPPPPDVIAFVHAHPPSPFPASVPAPKSSLVPAPVPAPVSPHVPGPVAQLKEEATRENDSDDPEELRLLLLSSIATKKQASGSKPKSALSPEVLKNAVKRFQSTGLPVKDEEESQDQQPVLEGCIKLEAEKEIPKETIAEPIQLNGALPVEPVKPPPPVVKLTIQAKKPTSPSTKIIKIVKPNKVINKKTTAKRKLPENELASSGLSIKRPTTLMIKEPSAPLHSQTVITSNTRLITTMDPASIKVNKLIINLAEESVSDEDLELSSCFAYANTDIASPLSLAMGSFSGSTTRSNTPISEIVETTPNANNNLRRTVINEYFEKKIDDFLKQARSKAPVSNSNSPEAVPEKIPEKVKAVEKQPKAIPTPKIPPAPKTTPVAVRHLPVASQKEYLRLVERMQMLEKKKVQAAKPSASVAKSKATTVIKTSKNSLPITTQVVKSPGKTLVRNATSSASKTISAAEKPKANNVVSKSQKAKAKLNQMSKECRLKAFENSFVKIGGSMLVSLDKSLQLVAEAKKSKAIRLRCSQRLKELYAEMQTVKQAVHQEELRQARIQPEIQASHETIISLKQKRQKLRAAAVALGHGLRGDDYRLIDEGKAAITSKSTQLTKEIRLYNSIVKYDDLEKLIDSDVSPPEIVIETDSKSCQPQEPNPQEPATVEPTLPPADPEIAIQTKTETEPASGNRPQTETVPPDDQAQDKAIGVPTKTSSPHTVTNMRELREEVNGFLRDNYLNAYRTPMSRNYNSHIDVHATICPFDLMGRCEDADCSYLHLARAELQNELPKTKLTHNN